MSLFEDGDRLYNLKNGEIISVPKSVMFIETDSLENASPSLLSRMSTNICLTQSLIENIELFKTMFVNTALPSVFSNLKSYIISMFTHIFEPILKSLRDITFLPLGSMRTLTIRFIETLDLLTDDLLKSYLI